MHSKSWLLFNCLLPSIPGVDPVVLTQLFQTYCLHLYSLAMWSLWPYFAFYHTEITFNRSDMLQIWTVYAMSSTVALILCCLQLLNVPLSLSLKYFWLFHYIRATMLLLLILCFEYSYMNSSDVPSNKLSSSHALTLSLDYS